MIRDAGLGQYSWGALLFRQACQLICPRRCPFCGRVLGFEPWCADCEARLKGDRRIRLARPRPLDGLKTVPVSWAAVPYWYEGLIRRSLICAKYENQPWTAVQLGCLLVRELFGVEIQIRGGVEVPRPGPRIPTECDLVVPVPSSGRGRAYNVPSLLALPVAQGLGVPADLQALRRRYVGQPQVALDRAERLVNVIGLFQADADRVAGRRVLLIDDVVTTGATAAACAQALLAAGAESVAFVALATPRSDTTIPVLPGIPFDQEAGPEDEETEIQDF